MELSAAASSFDDQPVLDAYSLVSLFDGQPDLFDASTQDSEAGWRRTLSASEVVAPARGCLKLGDDVYVAGRSVKDYFNGEVIREYVLLHPADSLSTIGSSDKFLGTAGAVSAYVGISWVKSRKEEVRTSEASPVYNIFCSDTELFDAGMVVLDPGGNYFRVYSVATRSGGLKVLGSYDLGANALRSVSYVSAGAYDPVTDSSSASAPVSIDSFVEFYSSNFLYEVNASIKFERSDKVVTVRKLDVVAPGPGDTLTDQGEELRVLERISDGECWALHVRPV